ncbi:MAG: tetratricopeptide repeat protein [Myxococcales bacterium]|nr:tetratricopeptide repeat protein [Myxococcales bacterium]MCA9628736.1 tetratricopeptide repeat protein [Myxococcales bacterium]MCB9524993.1 tetratricopeptide repeat protein [Myxococcales bacterium]
MGVQRTRLKSIIWAGAVLSGIAPSVAAAEPPQAVFKRLAEGVQALEKDYLAPALLEKRMQVTVRLNDGRLLYQTRDYERAAMVLLDVVENPEAKGQPVYREALYYLGDALFRIRNFRGAMAHLEELVRVGSGAERQRALGRLVEVALATHDLALADRYLTQAQSLLSAAPEPGLLYAVGKYRYELGQLDEATALFERVPADHALSRRALYFAAVVKVRRGELAQAETLFQDLVSGAAQATDPADQRVVDLARLALGRLAYERGDLAQAVGAYAQVPQTSKVFDASLIETVWIEIKRQDFDRALRKLEVQLIVKPDVVDGADARLLQGKLLMMLGRYGEASRAFEQVLVEFGPLKSEMRLTLSKQGSRLEAFLNEKIGSDLTSFDPSRFLPPKAARFSGTDDETNRAVNLVTDLALQRRDLDEAERMADQLKTALEAGSRVKIFPKLQEGWLRALEIQHQVALERGRLNDDAAGKLSAKNDAYKALRQDRMKWQRRYTAMPRTAVEMRARTARVDDEMARLDQEAFRLSVELQGIDAQLTAIDRYVKDTVGEEIAALGMPALRQVEQERGLAKALKVELEALVRAVEAERIRLGVNDDSSNEDGRTRAAFLDAVRSEARWLTANGAPFQGDILAGLDDLDVRLNAFFAKAGQLVDDRVTRIKAQVDRERMNVETYRRELQAVSSRSENLGGTVAARAFRQVYERIHQVVLEADVGLIDVAWKQKQDQSGEISRMLERQQIDLENVDRSFREVSLE